MDLVHYFLVGVRLHFYFLFYYLILSYFTAPGGASALVSPPPPDTSLVRTAVAILPNQRCDFLRNQNGRKSSASLTSGWTRYVVSFYGFKCYLLDLLSYLRARILWFWQRHGRPPPDYPAPLIRLQSLVGGTRTLAIRLGDA